MFYQNNTNVTHPAIYNNCICIQLLWLYQLNVCVSPGVYLDATQTAPTPATWAPTCRTRQPRTLCPGWRLAEAEENKLNQRPSTAPWILQQFTLTLCCYMFQSVLASFSWSCKLTPPPHKKLCLPSVLEGYVVQKGITKHMFEVCLSHECFVKFI